MVFDSRIQPVHEPYLGDVFRDHGSIERKDPNALFREVILVYYTLEDSLSLRYKLG